MVLRDPMRDGRRLITSLLFLVILLQSATALACQSSGANRVVITSGSNVVMTTPYSSSAPGDQIQTFTVTVNNPHNTKSCNFALSFTRSTLPATMSNGVSSLQYTIETTSGTPTLLQTTGFVFNSSPAAANRLAGFVAANSSVSLTVRARLPAGQTGLTGGTYSDAATRIGIYEISGTLPIALVEETTFTISASVATTCQIGTPSPASLNFSPAIVNGMPNASFVLTSSFTNVSCSQPSRLRLDGSAMQLTPSTTAADLDNFIHWRAQGTFSAATATLVTNAATTVTSSATNVASGATSGSTITINVNLLAGQPLLAGTYTGVLSVTVDPNP